VPRVHDPSPPLRARRAGRTLAAALVLLAGARLAGLGAATVAPAAADGAAAGRIPAEAVDLARDPPWRLAFLPGIGPARARAIVRLRAGGGRLGVIADLEALPGVGPETVRRIAASCAAGGLVVRVAGAPFDREGPRATGQPARTERRTSP
jgi:DNA uptake protein ComE-like DNA-binding protein